MQVEFVAKRPVTILGTKYAPGDVLTDTNIPANTISSLLNTRRIAQMIQNGDASAREHRAQPMTTLQAGDSPGGNWKALWAAQAEEGISYRQFLQLQCAERDLSKNGSVVDLLHRLDTNGVTPDGADD